MDGGTKYRSYLPISLHCIWMCIPVSAMRRNHTVVQNSQNDVPHCCCLHSHNDVPQVVCLFVLV